ncbi:MAG: hypothetical protein NWR30_06865 [Salibacteraceae bacterium]|nr:hypothetical protein [Salibacteraceae bacterium]
MKNLLMLAVTLSLGFAAMSQTVSETSTPAKSEHKCEPKADGKACCAKEASCCAKGEEKAHGAAVKSDSKAVAPAVERKKKTLAASPAIKEN